MMKVFLTAAGRAAAEKVDSAKLESVCKYAQIFAFICQYLQSFAITCNYLQIFVIICKVVPLYFWQWPAAGSSSCRKVDSVQNICVDFAWRWRCQDRFSSFAVTFCELLYSWGTLKEMCITIFWLLTMHSMDINAIFQSVGLCHSDWLCFVYRN